MAHPQITLKTQAEVDALDRIARHFEAPNDAEAFRHAQRILVRMIDVESKRGRKLVLAAPRGKGKPALVKPTAGKDLPVGSVRRWTVAMESWDILNQERIRAWADAPSKREANRVTVLVVGSILEAQEAGKVLRLTSGGKSEAVVLW